MKINFNNIFTIIVSFFILINIIFLYFSNGLSSFLMGADSYSYFNPAKNLVENGALMFSDGSYMHNNTPLYSLLIGLFFYLDSQYFYIYIIIIQVILLFSSVLISVKIFDFGSSYIKYIFLILLLFNPNLLITAHLCQTEILYLFFFILSLKYLFKFKNDYAYKNLLYCSLFISLSILTRPIGIYIFYCYIFLISIFLLLNYKLNYIIIAKLFFFIIITSSIVSIWIIRNYIIFDSFFLSSNSGYYAYDNLMQLIKISKNISVDETVKISENFFLNYTFINNLDQKCLINIRDIYCTNVHVNAFISYVFENNIVQTIKAFTYSFLNTYFSGGATNYSNYFNLGMGEKIYLLFADKLNISEFKSLIFSSNLIYFFIFIFTTLFSFFFRLLGFIGIIYFILQKKYFTVFILISILIMYTALFLFVGNSRFRVPLEPILMFFAVNGLIFLKIIKK